MNNVRLGLLLTVLTLVLAACSGGGSTPSAAPSAENGEITLAAGVTSGTLDLTSLINDAETAKADLSVAITTEPENGTTALDGKTVTYTLSDAAATSDSFVYTVTDANAQTDTGTVTVTITPEGEEGEEGEGEEGEGEGEEEPETDIQDGSQENPYVTYNGVTIIGNPTGNLAADVTVEYAQNAVYEGSAGTINFPVTLEEDKNFNTTLSFKADEVGAVNFPATATLEYTLTEDGVAQAPATLYFEIRGPSVPVTPEEAGPGGLIVPQGDTDALTLQAGQVLLGQGSVVNSQNGLLYSVANDSKPNVASLTLADGVSVGSVNVTGGIVGSDVAGDIIMTDLNVGFIDMDDASGSVRIDRVTVNGSNENAAISLNGVASAILGVTVNNVGADGRGIEAIDSNVAIFSSTVNGGGDNAYGFYIVNESLDAMRADISNNTVTFTAGARTLGFFADIDGAASNSLTFGGTGNAVTGATSPVYLECSPPMLGGFFIGDTDSGTYGCGIGQNRGTDPR